MTKKSLRYPTVLFDWGNTVMRDDPAMVTPMVEWETIEVVDGIPEVLAYLHSSGRRIVLATSATISDESQIRGALARGGIDTYFSHIYCFRNTNLPKGQAFYRHILSDLQISAADALMIGDDFEKDVQIPNTLGIFAFWFSSGSEQHQKNDFYRGINSMREVREFFESLDQKRV